MPTTILPHQVVKEQHLLFLDRLRLSGKTNMFGAGPYVEAHFGVDRHDAKAIVLYWMTTFEERHPQG